MLQPVLYIFCGGEIMSELYHYCSLETFKAIIQNKTIRFSDVMKSNDSNEIIFLWDRYYDYIEKTATNPSAIKMLKYEIKKQMDNMIFLTACFSKQQDSLHMWNCYADGGIAIGVDYNKLSEWSKRICYYNYVDRTYPNNASCVKMDDIEYYNKDNVEKFILKKCNGMEFVTDNFGTIFEAAPFFKSDFFQIEEEVRILIKIFVSNPYAYMLEYVDNIKNDSIAIRLKSLPNDNFINVIRADIPFPMDMVSSVIIGPNCALQKRDISQLLMINEFDINSIEIIESQGSYR